MKTNIAMINNCLIKISLYPHSHDHVAKGHYTNFGIAPWPTRMFLLADKGHMNKFVSITYYTTSTVTKFTWHSHGTNPFKCIAQLKH